MSHQDLIDRLRTCAVAIGDVDPREAWVELVTQDAARLLLEAANVLALDEPPELLGEPMEIIQPLPAPRPSGPTWTTTDLPTVAPTPCPCCGAFDQRLARVVGRKVMVTCPRCSHEWSHLARQRNNADG